MNDKTRKFIEQNLHADIRQLALQGCRDKEVDMPLALSQIAGRQAARRKECRHTTCIRLLNAWVSHLSQYSDRRAEGMGFSCSPALPIQEVPGIWEVWSPYKFHPEGYPSRHQGDGLQAAGERRLSEGFLRYARRGREAGRREHHPGLCGRQPHRADGLPGAV